MVRLPRQLREQVVAAMASPRRGEFLLALADALAFSAEQHERGAPGGPHESAERSAYREIAALVNERRAGESDDSHAADAFVEALSGAGAAIMTSVAWSVARALRLGAGLPGAEAGT
jgi:hypothetical protein